MPETKETLSIKAQFDASQLKGEAKKALSDLGNETKKLQSDFQSVDRAAVQNLRNIKNQADGAAKAVKQIGTEVQNSSKQLKQISLQQSVGIVSRGAQIAAGAIASSQYGQTESGSALAGGLSGAATGAMMGAPLGPAGATLGAAAGALLGAGHALLEAANKQKEATLTEYEKYKQNLASQDAARENQKWQGRLGDYAKNYGDVESQTNLNNEINEYAEKIRKNKEAEEEVRRKTEERIAWIANNVAKEKENVKQSGEAYAAANAEYERLARERTELETKYNDLIGIRVSNEQKSTNNGKSVSSEIQGMLSGEKSKYANISDSLVKIGGGGSYVGVNSAINSNVAKIVSTLNNLLKTAQLQLAVSTRTTNTASAWG